MDQTSSRYSNRGVMGEPTLESASVAALTMRPTTYQSPRGAMQDRFSISETSSRSRSQERIQLPSIRDLVPDIQFQAGPKESDLKISVRSYSTGPLGPGTPYTPPEHASSPSSNKRRRLSPDDDGFEGREHVVPRLYRESPRIPPLSSSGAISPASSIRRGSVFSTGETWTGSAQTSPYMGARGLPAPPQPFEVSGMGRPEWRPSLPNLPPLPNASTTLPSGRTQFSEYSLDSSRAGPQTYPQLNNSMFEPPKSPYHQSPPPTFSYGYQQPRGQSYSGPSSYPLSQDRTAFSSNGHFSMHHGAGFPSYGGIDPNDGPSDSKQRKRRGNLPKETTDKLRAWFVAHLQHPYPTEDEKQDLMRQTGLQMNQISNWFINARRRQLPAMINNARAESSATAAGTRQGQGESASDFGDHGGRRGSEGSAIEFGEETFERRLKRESI